MAKVSSLPAIPFLSKHTPAQEEDEEEEYDMANHSTEDRVRPSHGLGLMSYKPRPTC